jgi:hypothetical protein
MLFEVTDNDLKSLVKVVAATKYSNGFKREINYFKNIRIILY